MAEVIERTPTRIVEHVRTEEGELIPRGPIGERSVYTTPRGRIINMDTDGLPLTRGPKSEIIKVEVGQPETPDKVYVNPTAQAAAQETPAAVSEQPATKLELKIEDLEILKNEPWLLGGDSKEA